MAAEDAPPPPLNYIPEVVLKKRKNNEEWAIKRNLQLQERAKRRRTEGSRLIKKPEQFVREYREKELDLVRMSSRAKGRRITTLDVESKLLFVTRIGGKNDMHPKTRKLLYSLRLRKIFSGVFVKASEGSMEILQKLEPYVTYGYPNVKTVKDLIYKKGVIKAGKERIPLTDNNIIEQELGQYNILCIEDIVNDIANFGPHFKEVTRFLCPFMLNNPVKALHGKKKRFEDGGDSGNRGDIINELVSKMN